MLKQNEFNILIKANDMLKEFNRQRKGLERSRSPDDDQ